MCRPYKPSQTCPVSQKAKPQIKLNASRSKASKTFMHTFFYKLKFYNWLILLDFSKSTDRVGMYEQLLLSVVPRGTLDHFQPVRGQKKMPGSGGKPIFSKCKEILRCSEDFPTNTCRVFSESGFRTKQKNKYGPSVPKNGKIIAVVPKIYLFVPKT